MSGNAHHIVLAHIAGIASFAMPDGLASFGEKLLAAIVIGLFTGAASKLGSFLVTRITKGK